MLKVCRNGKFDNFGLGSFLKGFPLLLWSPIKIRGRRAQQVEQAKPSKQTRSHVKFDLCEQSERAKRNLHKPSRAKQTKQRTQSKPSVVLHNFREICLKTRVSERESPTKSSNLSSPNAKRAPRSSEPNAVFLSKSK